MRKLFWNLGGILPVWMVHPGQIILALERRLGKTLFKGATLPAWWTPNIMSTAIFLAGMAVTITTTFGLAFWVVDLQGGAENLVEKLGVAVGLSLLFITPVTLIVCGAAMSVRLSTIWPWRHLRVAVCTVEEGWAACKIAREPCVFEHFDGSLAKKHFVHWFWGPTLGSRDWMFRFRPVGDVGTETNHSFMVVTDRTGASMSFTIHEMTDADNIYPWRGQCLYWANEAAEENWFELLHTLFMRSAQQLMSAKQKVVSLSDELRLARIESEAWIQFMHLLGEYFGNGRTTRPDKEIARLLGDASIVMAEHMGLMRQNGRPYSHDEGALRKRFEGMDWPVLAGARRQKKRLPVHHTAHTEPDAHDAG